MHYCIVLAYLSVSSMSQTALYGQLCIRSFLSDLIWDEKNCTVWGCAPHDLDDLTHTGLPSHQHAASSASLSWVLQGLQSGGWVWVYVSSSQATLWASLCSAWSLPLLLCFSWLLTWRPRHSCGYRDGSSAPIQLLALRASATQKYTHWSLWELVQTCGHSKTWLSEPWSLASSLWPVVSLLSSSQIPYPTCRQVWLEIFLEITQPCTDKGLMFPRETCTHTTQTYSSLSSCCPYKWTICPTVWLQLLYSPPPMWVLYICTPLVLQGCLVRATPMESSNTWTVDGLSSADSPGRSYIQVLSWQWLGYWGSSALYHPSTPHPLCLWCLALHHIDWYMIHIPELIPVRISRSF